MEPEESPLAPPSSTRAWITGSIRTLSNIDPTGISGAIVQSWTEFDEHKQAQRVSEFFEALKLKLEAVEDLSRLNAQRISDMPDAAEVLEQCVEASIKEVNDDKRRIYSDLYFNFLCSSDKTTPDERFDIVLQLEQLTISDIAVLKTFAERGCVSGDVLTNTTNPAWQDLASGLVAQPKIRGHRSYEDDFWERHSGIVHSVVKLESRGLIAETPRRDGFMESGDSSSDRNRFRRKAWRITPIGRSMAQMLVGAKG